MKKTLKFEIQYDGSSYYGWEHQPNRPTIQGKLEDSIEKLLSISKDSFTIVSAGRTDAGVHAKNMVASCELDTDMPDDLICKKLNTLLPSDIAILSVKTASDRFHARYNAVGKTYEYSISDGEIKPIFNRKYVTILDTHLDIVAMKEASKYMIGRLDFKSFCGNSHFKKSTVRIVDKITIKREKGIIKIRFHGTGFLQNMVRIMTGTLIEVGLHKIAPLEVENIIKAKDRKFAGPTAPAKGLTLIKVDY